MFWVEDILDVIVFATDEALGFGVDKVPRSAQGHKCEFTIIREELKHFWSFVAEIKSVLLVIL